MVPLSSQPMPYRHCVQYCSIRQRMGGIQPKVACPTTAFGFNSRVDQKKWTYSFVLSATSSRSITMAPRWAVKILITLEGKSCRRSGHCFRTMRTFKRSNDARQSRISAGRTARSEFQQFGETQEWQFSTVHVVLKIRSPASPRPGTMYLRSLRQRSMAHV